MARGNIAKENIAKRIAAAFGADYIGVIDKKIYVWSEENGERVQIAMSMTCPKNPVGDEIIQKQAVDEDGDFPDIPTSAAKPMTEDEMAIVTRLSQELGL